MTLHPDTRHPGTGRPAARRPVRRPRRGRAVPPRRRAVASGAAGVALAGALALLAGCSVSRFAVTSTMVPVIANARDAAFASDDVRTLRDAAPANLFLLEGLIRTAPDAQSLRVDAAMLYFAYAFAFVEEDDPGYASMLYRKGWAHGREALSRRRPRLRDAFDGRFSAFEAELRSLRRRDVPAAVWTAVNWAQFISLHLDSTAVLRDIPKVSALLARAAELDSTYFDGLVFVMSGSLHAFKPPVMGGDPRASRRDFERAFRIGGEGFLLPRYFYARFYLYRVQDADAFRSTLEAVIRAPIDEDDPYRMLDLIAKRKARTLLGEIDDLF